MYSNSSAENTCMHRWTSDGLIKIMPTQSMGLDRVQFKLFWSNEKLCKVDKTNHELYYLKLFW